jgi:transcriptional regulator with XRE-family HTH domain
VKRHRNKQLLLKVACRIKQLRENAGVTQEEFYNDTGINLGRIEQGINDPSVSTIERICDYFGIELAEFFKKGF